jgi:hypothetical protein
MTFFTKHWTQVLLAGVVALTVQVGLVRGQAANNFRVAPNAGDANGPAGFAAGPAGGQGAAGFQPPAMVQPYYSTNPYTEYKGPYGGYLSGVSDVINSQSQFLESLQTVNLMREEVNRSKLDTRRKSVDEYLYERANLPTIEDDRERQRIEALRRAHNDPPMHEILSGLALNNLLLAIIQMHGKKGPGPTVPIDPDLLRHINVTSGTGSDSVGVLRNGGKLSWPLVLKRAAFQEGRDQLNELAPRAMKQAMGGSVEADVLDGMTSAVENLDVQVKRQIAQLTPREYSQAKSFLRQVRSSIRALQDTNVANYATQKWSPKGNNVGELMESMNSQGLKFAPATQGDEPAYLALHRAMVAYYAGPEYTAQWDRLAK